MSFNLGQFRKNMMKTDEYSETLKVSVDDYNVDANFEEESITSNFKDKVITLNDGTFNTGVNYYLSFEVERLLSSQIFTVYLKNSGAKEEEGDIQEIATYTVARGNGDANETVTFEMIIVPNAVYDQIILELRRTLKDDIQADGSYTGRVMKINVLDCKEIKNVLNYIKKTPLIKIGVQGPTGLLMCINGEAIRIGKSGIYEILNDYDIKFIGFIIKPSSSNINDEDYFILDYQY